MTFNLPASDGTAKGQEDSHVRQDDPEIRRRISRWHSTGDLGALWPDFTTVELYGAHDEVYAATRAILREPGATATLEAATDRRAAALGIAAFASGMGPLLGW
ncbi:MAG TPA: hypothetical protein VNL18_01175, partial [Gemmatimonadales bacterium]|nr:hypothetical protein [Gemmatimonadales bacterium]